MRGINRNTAGTANIAKAPQQVLTDYINGENNLSQDKQQIINAIHDLDLTSDAAKEILAKLNESDGQGQNQAIPISASETVDIILIIEVLNKLKSDRCSYFHSGSTEAYKVMIEGLKNISIKSENIAQGRGDSVFDVSAKSYFFAAESSKFDTNNLSSAIKARASLRKANLRGVQLGKLSAKELEKIDVKDAKLDKELFKSFYQAGVRNFSGCDLSGQDLQDVDFTGTTLTNVNFTNATLTNVNFANATLSEEAFTNTNVKLDAKSFEALYNAGVRNFSGCDLSGQDFSDVDLTGTTLSKTMFTNVKLNVTCFEVLYNAGARNFSGCDLSEGTIYLDGLGGINFTGANFTNVTFDAQAIGDVNFTDATFSNTSFSCVRFSGTTFGTENSFLNAPNTKPKVFHSTLEMNSFIALFRLGVTDFQGCALTACKEEQPTPKLTQLELDQLKAITFENMSLDFESLRTLQKLGLTNFSGWRFSFQDIKSPDQVLLQLRDLSLTGMCVEWVTPDQTSLDALLEAGVSKFKDCNLSGLVIDLKNTKDIIFSNISLIDTTFINHSENNKIGLNKVKLNAKSFKSLLCAGVKDFSDVAELICDNMYEHFNDLSILLEGVTLNTQLFRKLVDAGVKKFIKCNVVEGTGSCNRIVCHKMDLSDASFINISLGLSLFKDVNLSNASFKKVYLRKAKFENVDLRGAKFENVDLKNVLFDDCIIDGQLLNIIPHEQLMKCKLYFPEGYSARMMDPILTAINGNDDKSVRNHFMKQVFRYFKDKVIDPLENQTLQLILSSNNRDYSSALNEYPDFRDKIKI